MPTWDISKNCNIYTNKKFITNRLSKYLKEGVPLNANMSPDIDILMQIIHEIKILNSTYKINTIINTINKPLKQPKRQQAQQISTSPDHPHLALLELTKTYAIQARTEKIQPIPTNIFYPQKYNSVTKE